LNIPRLGGSDLWYDNLIMAKVIAGMSMSLDGYINDRNGSVEKLYSDFNAMHDVSSFKEMIEHTGAVIMGRHVYEMCTRWQIHLSGLMMIMNFKLPFLF